MTTITIYDKAGKPEWGFNVDVRTFRKLYFEATGLVVSW